jgi:putative transposase
MSRSLTERLRLCLVPTLPSSDPAALARNGWHWRGLDDLEIATCASVSWFNEHRLHGDLGDRSPTEFEAEYRHYPQTTAA